MTTKAKWILSLCLLLGTVAVPALAQDTGGPLDQWVKYSAEDWGFLVSLCALAIWFDRSKIIPSAMATIVPPLGGLVYGVYKALETGYGFGTHLMYFGITMAAGSIAAQVIAARIVPTPTSSITCALSATRPPQS